MPGDEGYLSAFLTSEEIEEFEAARASQRPFLATGREDRFSEFFRFEDLEHLVNQTNIWAPNRLDVLMDTKKVPPNTFFDQLQLVNGVRYRLNTHALQKLLSGGASLVLIDIDGMTKGLKKLKEILAGYSGAKVEANLYYSQPRHQAFEIHFDVHEVCAFQVAGAKRWRVYQQAHKFPINHLAFLSGDVAKHERAKGPVSMDLVMSEGDFLYLPSGYYHQAICTNSTSIHLSYSIVEMIGLDVVSELFDTGVLDEFFRTPVSRCKQNGSSEGYLKLLAENLTRLATDDQFAERIEEKLRSFPYSTSEVTIRK